jgi:hypothetical protein
LLPDGSENKTYYAPGVGLIKDVSIYDGAEMGITLEKITETRQ